MIRPAFSSGPVTDNGLRNGCAKATIRIVYKEIVVFEVDYGVARQQSDA